MMLQIMNYTVTKLVTFISTKALARVSLSPHAEIHPWVGYRCIRMQLPPPHFPSAKRSEMPTVAFFFLSFLVWMLKQEKESLAFRFLEAFSLSRTLGKEGLHLLHLWDVCCFLVVTYLWVFGFTDPYTDCHRYFEQKLLLLTGIWLMAMEACFIVV